MKRVTVQAELPIKGRDQKRYDRRVSPEVIYMGRSVTSRLSTYYLFPNYLHIYNLPYYRQAAPQT